jgi:hypothetical protein
MSFMLGKRSALASVFAGAVVALVVISLRLATGHGSGALPRDVGIRADVHIADAPITMDEIARGGVAAVEVALQRIDHLERWSGVSPRPDAADSRCVWPTGVRRSSASLAAEFLKSGVRANLLLRHVILNERDVPPCPDEVKEFLAIIERYESLLAPVFRAYGELRIREKIEIVDAGLVKPWQTDEDVSAELARRAAILMAERNMSKSEAMQEAEKGMGSKSQPPAVNRMWHNGKHYLDSDFPPLPRSAAFFENVKFVIGEYAAWVMSWFVAKGFCSDPAQILQVLEEIATAPAR